jgi:hypothetical protein
MGDTLNTIVEKARRLLMPIQPMQIKLASNYTAGSGTITVDNTSAAFPAVVTGATLCMGIQNFYVTGQPNSGTGATPVISAWNGSPDLSVNTPAFMEINPRFTRFDIYTAAIEEIRSLDPPSAGLGQVGQINNLTFIPVFQGYDLTNQPGSPSVLPTSSPPFDTVRSRVLEVSYKIAPPFRTYPLLRRGDYRIYRQADTTVFPSGSAIIIYRAAWPGFPLTVQYLSPFTPPVSLTDDLYEVCGIPAPVQDIVYMGTMLRLAADKEISRNDMTRQPDPRKPTEVTPGAMMNADGKLMLRYMRRRNEEASVIKRAWPFAESLGSL